MPAEIFYAYWDPAATPLLTELLEATPLVAATAALPTSLEPYLHPQVQRVTPRVALLRQEGVVARLYGDGEEMAEEVADFMARGHEATCLQTLGARGPELPPPAFMGRRILVARSAAQAGAVLAGLRLRGARPLLLPALRIAPALDARPLETALERVGTYRYILFTSQNAVQNFFAALDAKAIDVRRLGDARIMAVGAATALGLRARGILAEIARVGTAMGLAAQLAGRVRVGDRALLLGPEPPDAALVQALWDLGLQVDGVPIYRTLRGVAPQDATALLREGRPDAVLFYSPSAVQATVAALPEGYLDTVPAVAIGPTTGAACLELGLSVKAQAQSPGLPGILSALREVLSAGAD